MFVYYFSSVQILVQTVGANSKKNERRQRKKKTRRKEKDFSGRKWQCEKKEREKREREKRDDTKKLELIFFVNIDKKKRRLFLSRRSKTERECRFPTETLTTLDLENPSTYFKNFDLRL